MQKSPFTREMLIDLVRREAAADPRLTCRRFCRKVGVNESTLGRLCESWTQLKLDAGLSPHKVQPGARYRPEDIVDRYRRLVGEHGRLTMTRFCRLTGISEPTVRKLVGTWPEVQRAAGFEPAPPPPSGAALVQALVDLEAEAGERVPNVDFCRHVGIDKGTIIRHFGSWDGLRRAAGVADRKLPSRARHTLESFTRQLKEYVAAHGDTSRPGFARHLGVSPTTIINVCGSWGALRVAAGLSARKRTAVRLISDRDLLEDLWRVHDKLGRFPFENDYDKEGRFSWQTLIKRFGSYTGRVDPADLPHLNWSKRESLKARFADYLGNEVWFWRVGPYRPLPKPGEPIVFPPEFFETPEEHHRRINAEIAERDKERQRKIEKEEEEARKLIKMLARIATDDMKST